MSSVSGSAFGAELGDRLSVDGDPPVGDVGLRRAARGDAGRRENFLKALGMASGGFAAGNARFRPTRERSRQRSRRSASAALGSNGSGLVVDRRLRQRARQLEAKRVGHLFDLRQIAEVVQPEAIEELTRRRIHERTADDLFAADGLDQTAARPASTARRRCW